MYFWSSKAALPLPLTRSSTKRRFSRFCFIIKVKIYSRFRRARRCSNGSGESSSAEGFWSATPGEKKEGIRKSGVRGVLTLLTAGREAEGACSGVSRTLVSFKFTSPWPGVHALTRKAEVTCELGRTSAWSRSDISSSSCQNFLLLSFSFWVLFSFSFLPSLSFSASFSFFFFPLFAWDSSRSVTRFLWTSQKGCCGTLKM